MMVMIAYGARSRPLIEAQIEAGLRILDGFDAATLQDLEPELPEPDNDDEVSGDTWPDFIGGEA